MWRQKLRQEKKHRQDVNVVLLQEKLRGEEQQEKLLAKEKQRENDADLFLFFYIWYELLIDSFNEMLRYDYKAYKNIKLLLIQVYLR